MTSFLASGNFLQVSEIMPDLGKRNFLGDQTIPSLEPKFLVFVLFYYGTTRVKLCSPHPTPVVVIFNSKAQGSIVFLPLYSEQS